jgi:hypothetical protein
MILDVWCQVIIECQHQANAKSKLNLRMIMIVKVLFGDLGTNHGTTLKLSVSHLEPLVPVAGCQSAPWRS